MKDTGTLPITDYRMTRFLITLPEAVEIVIHAFKEMIGSEIFVKKIPSVKIKDLARIIAPNCKTKEIGMRPGEKLHEQMISADEAAHTYEFDKYYKILSPLNEWDVCLKRIKGGKKVENGFEYTSDKNDCWLDKERLKSWLSAIDY